MLTTSTKIYDSHTHLLEMKKKGMDLTTLLQEWKKSSIGWLMDAGTSEKHFQDRLSYLSLYPHIIFSAGIHPGECKNLETQLAAVETQLNNPHVKAVGEIGLDYFWKDIDRSIQMDFFVSQLELAIKYDYPVIIHNREADEDIYTMLKQSRVKGVMHCFSSSRDWAQRFLDLGLYISFAGNVTYKKSQPIQDAARFVPLERLLIETDAPYLAPQAVRGKKNHPGYLKHTAEFIAELRNESPQEIIAANQTNFEKLFKIDEATPFNRALYPLSPSTV